MTHVNEVSVKNFIFFSIILLMWPYIINYVWWDSRKCHDTTSTKGWAILNMLHCFDLNKEDIRRNIKFTWLEKSVTRTFLNFPSFFLTLLLFQKLFAAIHTSDYAFKVCRTPHNKLSCIHILNPGPHQEQVLYITSIGSVISPPQGWTLRWFMFITLTCFLYPFVHEETYLQWL